MEDQEAGVDEVLIRRRGVHDLVDRLIDGGVGIEIGAKFYTILLEIVDHALAGEVLATLEGHVLKEVSETALGILLEDATDTLRDVEVGSILGLLVVTDDVGEPVVELAHPHILVDRQRRCLLRCILRSTGEYRHCGETHHSGEEGKKVVTHLLIDFVYKFCSFILEQI